MNETNIAELFIQAAETERKLPEVKGLRVSYGRYVLPWVHSVSDVNGRGRTNVPAKDKRDPKGEKLIGADDPIEEWRMAWLTDWGKRATKEQVAGWEACLRITSEFLVKPGERRALWAWAIAKSGGKSFAKWCRSEGISEMTGHRRKNRALTSIVHGIDGKANLHDESGHSGVLLCEPENEHVFATVEGQRAVYDTQRVLSWRDDPSFQRKTGMTLAEWRAAKRRQQEQRRKQAA